MTRSSGSASAFITRQPKTLQIALYISGGVMLLLLAGFAVSSHQSSVMLACTAAESAPPELNFDDGTDIQAADKYEGAIATLLMAENFHELDCIADSVRTNKERFSGGMWKLHLLYNGLSSPRQHATEEDWQAHLDRLNRWVSVNPGSITARVALAHAYVDYGWDARGNGYSDTVSDSGRNLYEKRIAKAKGILEDAAKLPTKCPEWYIAMQQVAQSQGWPLDKDEDLLRQAEAIQPDYYYIYRMQADMLLPKWYGEEGDSENFLNETADRIGGEQGDIIYFQVASYMTCNCGDETHLQHLSWPRIQRGFSALEKQNGASLTNLNLLASMAVQEKDAIVAKNAFDRIGDQWNQKTWHKESYFQQCKKWASDTQLQMSHQKSLENEADANEQAVGGAMYRASFDQKFNPMAQSCMQATPNDHDKFVLLVQVGAGGTVQRIETNPTPEVAMCLFQKLMNFQMTKTAPFPNPPHTDYWVKVALDPGDLAATK